MTGRAAIWPATSPRPRPLDVTSPNGRLDVAYSCDDTVVAQSLVAAVSGVAILNGLALYAHRAPGIHTTPLTDNARAFSPPRTATRQTPTRHDALIEILTSLP